MSVIPFEKQEVRTVLSENVKLIWSARRSRALPATIVFGDFEKRQFLCSRTSSPARTFLNQKIFSVSFCVSLMWSRSSIGTNAFWSFGSAGMARWRIFIACTFFHWANLTGSLIFFWLGVVLLIGDGYWAGDKPLLGAQAAVETFPTTEGQSWRSGYRWL